MSELQTFYTHSSKLFFLYTPAVVSVSLYFLNSQQPKKRKEGERNSQTAAIREERRSDAMPILTVSITQPNELPFDHEIIPAS